MSRAEEDKKPGADGGAHINLKVMGLSIKRISRRQLDPCTNYLFRLPNHRICENEVFFRMKRSTQLEKLMNAYCDRMSVHINSIAFLFDGCRLFQGLQTPDELEMEDGDEILAMLHQPC